MRELLSKDSKLGIDSQTMRALMRFVNMGQAIWITDDLNNIVHDVYLKNGDFAAIINLISETAASIPWVEEELNGEVWEGVNESRLLDLWNVTPNTLQGPIEFRKETFAFYLMLGNGFISSDSPKAGLNAGIPKHLWNMPPHLTEIVSGGWREPVRGYKLKIGDETIEIPCENVLHMKNFNPNYQNGNWLYGKSKISSALRAVTSSNNGYITKSSMLKNGGIPGVLTSKEGHDPLTLPQKTNLWDTIKRYANPFRKGQVPYFNKPLEFVRFGETMVDLAVIESLLADKRAMCSTYSVSAGLFNDPEGSTYNNKREEKKALYNDAIIPLCDQLQGELNRWIIPRFYKDQNVKRRLRPDYSGITVLQQEFKETAEAIKGLPIIVPRDIFERLDIDIPNGASDELLDTIYVNFGLQKLSDLGDSGLNEEAEKAIANILEGDYK